ncbi:AAA-ATPase ASD, mitochondrial isoform X2 [Quercus suber]|uniref:AAA-ATPase ASD, mitochondrial isoform X2 n=1 Tax=Quercus suber TaxID=58331 RepID=UPI0032DECE55
MMMAEIWSLGGSLQIATIVFLWKILENYFSGHLRRSIISYGTKLASLVSPYIYIKFPEFVGDSEEYVGVKRSDAYAAIETYLSGKSSREAKYLKAIDVKDSSQPVQLSMDENEGVTDEFEGIKLSWVAKKEYTITQQSFSFNPQMDEKRYYELTFHKSHRDFVNGTYINHVIQKGKAITVSNRQRKLYTNNPSQSWERYRARKWSHATFEHPKTFDTLAMESKKKLEIVNDLENFSKGKDYHKKIGKAWKRGYLLYGPPGTGKSSMIAAMANHLEYDIYDLELTTVKNNTELRKLLIETTDGLWSAIGGEKIFVFTTNYVERLDPALIRRGRMDMYIELSYCGFEAFKVLAKNYLDIDSHPLFATIGHLLEETNITPAEVAEKLMPKCMNEDAETCLKKLIEALETAKDEAKMKAEEEARLKVETEEKEKQEDALEDVKVDGSLAKVKENCVGVVKDNGATA